jgi:Fic family protein
MNISPRQKNIIHIVKNDNATSISQIKNSLSEEVSIPTLNRDIATLVKNNVLLKQGSGPATFYSIAPHYNIFAPLDAGNYFEQDPDAREALTQFNYELIDTLETIPTFTATEANHLENLKEQYQSNISDISPALHQKELERLTIELSWKSSQIEGNTYSLLETEQLFRDKIEAEGKPKEDATMLLNHKYALDYLLAHQNIANDLSLTLLEEIHALLIKDLGVGRNIRSRTVGITGTAYKPLDNAHQIKEYVENMCRLINSKDNGFEKALLAVALISYIQPFEDGNKRTARMMSNAILMNYGACPLSYRSVDALDYKKAMLLFYEQNNLSAFKEIFIQQNEFSVKNYFQ